MQNSIPSQLFRAPVPLSKDDVIGRVLAVAPLPLLPGEKEDDYANLASRVVRAVKPKDSIEEFLTRDVADLTWEFFGCAESRPEY